VNTIILTLDNGAVLITSSHDIWKEIWEDNVHNTEGVLLRYLDSVYEFLGIAIKSPSWSMKAQVRLLKNIFSYLYSIHMILYCRQQDQLVMQLINSVDN